MRRPGVSAGLLLVFLLGSIWVVILTRAASAKEEQAKDSPGIPVELKTFSCCEANIDFQQTGNGKINVEQVATSSIEKGKRTLDIKVMFHLTWVCRAKTDEPRHCVGRFSINIKNNPKNTSGEGPTSSEVLVTKINENFSCPNQGTTNANGIFIFHYLATYGDSSPINGTLDLNLTLEPKTKGNINHTYSLTVRTKGGQAVDLGGPTIKPIQ
jgi:hypothetical protein